MAGVTLVEQATNWYNKQVPLSLIMKQGVIKKIFVKDIMTKEVTATSPETSLLDVAKIIAEHNFNGLPVIDKENKVVGIITEFDLIAKASEVTITTLRKVLKDVYESTDDNNRLKEKSDEIYPLKVSDVMTVDPITTSVDSTFEELIDLFKKNQRINPIPVVDSDNKLIGLISRSDILKPLRFYIE